KISRQLFLILLPAVLLCGCSDSATSTGASLPLPPVAKDVSHSTPEGQWQQTNYVVEIAYPDSSVAEFYLTNIKKPWVRCFAGIPQWSAVADASGRDRLVQQRVMHWVNRKDSKLVMVAMRYYSSSTNEQNQPDNASQYVSVTEYPAQDIEHAIGVLKLKCDK
ncbi:MAG TPA: hypothetical protein VES91_04280, partial [Burkholderiaceae bacterium]|nr:hypothetical protein [Burkholderiaceae bacterium]